MEKQEYILESPESFEPKHIFECGQCFRWRQNEDKSYTGVIKAGVVNVQKQNDKIIFRGMCDGDLKSVVTDYFDLDQNYREIKQKLAQIDEFMQVSTRFGDGIRILHQDLWECIISFIISANNNIPRIQKIIERIAKEYGQKIDWEGKQYYTFPNPEELSQASIEDLRACGLGFRDERIFHTTKMILEKQIDLNELQNLNDSRTNS